MPHSHKSHNSSSRKSHSSKHSSRHTSSYHSSSSSSTHPFSSTSHYSSHSHSPEPYPFEFNNHGGLSNYKDIPASSKHKSSSSTFSYATQQERKAKEDAKRDSRSRSSRVGPSSSGLDKEQRRKQQNRDSSRATDAGKRARMAAVQDIYVTESINEANKEAQLRHYQELNYGDAAYLAHGKSRKHKH